MAGGVRFRSASGELSTHGTHYVLKKARGNVHLCLVVFDADDINNPLAAASSLMKAEKGELVAIGYQTMLEIERTARLSRLFAEQHRRVLRAAYRITGCMADAEDVAQGVFLRMASGESDPVTNPDSYLYRAAINGALDLLRRRKTMQTEPLDAASDIACNDGDSSPEMNVSIGELRAWLRDAISNLSPRAAEMFTLRYLEGRDNREIASLLRTSQAVVAVTLHNTRSKLKKQLQEFERGRQCDETTK